MHSPPYADRARAELAAVTRANGVLSAREREVAELVARGLSNRDIGRRLFISERTSETHVSHIMRKLDLPSRAAIAAWISRPDG
jgi:DNA-binding NarL/FixJ family response regulator